MKENYFQHDYNPTNDPKIVCLLGNYGGLGYGVFWRIIELLHQEKSNKLPTKSFIYEAIAKQMLTSAEQIQTIINDCFKFELLEHDKGYFWSNRVITNIKKRQEISEKRSFAGKIGANIKQLQANAKQNVAKESKVKEKKDINILASAKNNSQSQEQKPIENPMGNSKGLKELYASFGLPAKVRSVTKWQDEASAATKLLNTPFEKISSVFKCFKDNNSAARSALTDCKELGKYETLYFLKVYNEIIKKYEKKKPTTE